MQREIKFKVWYPEAKRMYLPVKGCDLFIRIDGLRFCQMDVMENTGLDPVTDSMIFLQYTGLKDKNGVEIYEGDVLVERLGNQHGGKPFEVAYLPDRGTFVGKWTIPAMAKIEPDVQYGLVFQEIGMIPLEYEVIGNIHQNPKLLTK